MDFGASFSYITEDEDWIKKILIGAVLVLTGVGMIAVNGWVLEIIRRYNQGDQELLPDWSEIGQYFIDGLKMIVAVFVWTLPVIILAACPTIGSVIAAQNDDLAVVGLILNICGGLLIFVYSLLIWFLFPALIGTLAETGSIGQAINPSNAFKLFRANIGGFILASLVGGIAVSLLGSLGTILCVVGSFVGTAFGQAVLAHLIGQAYKNAKANVAEAPAM